MSFSGGAFTPAPERGPEEDRAPPDCVGSQVSLFRETPRAEVVLLLKE